MTRKVTLKIHYHTGSGLAAGLIMGLLVVALLTSLAWGQHKEAAAAGLQGQPVSLEAGPLATSAGMPGYYLTRDPAPNGLQALTACAPGYHMASLWEILDPSQLRYDVDLGAARDDSGHGPPSFLEGLIRTGYNGNTNLTAGQANCDHWQSNDPGHYGTYAQLPESWVAGQDIHVWQVGLTSCASAARVWCVQEDYTIYLPLMLKG